jgi:SAM-dependent methyltransferase
MSAALTLSDLLLDLIQCPNCRSPLNRSLGQLQCRVCGFGAPVLGSRLVGLRATDYSKAKFILEWPDEIIDRIEKALVALWPNATASGEIRSLLNSVRLVSEDGKLTPLGSHLQYNSLEYEWQRKYDVLEGMIRISDLPAAPRILDLGCGAGQTFRNLSLPRDALSVGVDYSAEALAYGSVVCRTGAPDIFCCASAHNLPIRDQSFDFVISRASINYCHQKQCLHEAIRVLRPGGFLFCRVEQIWWDLNVLSETRSILGELYNLRNLFWGLLHDVTGLQPAPGSVIRGSRAYTSKARFKRIVEPLGCEVLRFEDSSRGPQCLGHGTQAKVLCRRVAQAV